jgi:hypothetical protein
VGSATVTAHGRGGKTSDGLRGIAVAVNVVVTTKNRVTLTFEDWDVACGAAVRDALDGAENVLLIDSNGLVYHVYAEPVEDNS